ncbi:restriction endonuclease subunit S [Marasmitruncus massiliensis]|uniref:restriction endonuclease subunit S n=1 Tax=Marasmitruncus massiliensis TaxID=1944642 RepID=UPI000C7D77FA|nr:restriction endonuclease subunit S [Marasmitruncus massiliensis]
MISKKLIELCISITDCPHSTPEWTNGGKLVIRNQYIKNGKMDLSNPSYTTEQSYLLRRKRAKPCAGDIIITREAPMGEVCMIPEGLECCLGQRMVLLKPNKAVCDNRYLLYILMSKYVQHQISWSDGTGTTVSNLRIPHLESLQIPYISLSEQRAMAATLSCLDNKIELNNKINANLEAQAQAIFKSWFVDFEPFQDGEFVESELGLIPKGWRVGKLGDIARYVGERIPVSHCNTENYISTENMQVNKQGVIEATSLPSMPAVSRYEEHDILISNIRPYFKKIWFSDKVGGCSNDVLVFRAKHAAFIGVLYSVLYSDTFFEHATATSKGTKMPRGDKTAIMSYPIALPEIPDSSIYIQQLNIMVLEFQKKITGLRKENQTLAALRDALLPKLMSGEIEV